MSTSPAGVLHRFRRPILLGWIVALVVAGIAAGPLAGRLSGGGWYVPDSQSSQAAQALRTGFTGWGESNLILVVKDERSTAADPAFAGRVAAAIRTVTADSRLRASGSYGWLDASPSARAQFTGRDGRTTITAVALTLPDGEARRVLPTVQDEITSRYAGTGLRVALVSAASFFGEVNQLSAEGLTTAELITFPLILIILLILFRGVAAALVSLAVGGSAIVLALGVLSVFAARYELSIFVQNAGTMIGLGVGIDYSLFMISRYREELDRGRDRIAALVVTMRTSGETVAFSGLIVVAAMSSLFLVNLNVIRSLALGTITVVLCAVLVSLVVLPALLAVLGDRISWGRLPGRRDPAAAGRRWQTLAHVIMRRPVAFLTLAVVALGALALPALGMKTFTPDARIVPQSVPVRFGYDAIRAQFGIGAAAPIQVVVRSDAPVSAEPAAAGITTLVERLSALPGAARTDSALTALRVVDPARPLAALDTAAMSRLPADARAAVDHYVSADRHSTIIEVVPDDYPSSDRTRDLLTAIRDLGRDAGGSGLRVVTGGETAEGVDANTAISAGLPRVVLMMLAVIYLLLLLTFRSLLLPIKAILLNLLSLGATYGALVLVFQDGHGAGLLGAQQFGYLQNFVPILLLAILVSLSTDYEVFLLNRIREERKAGAGETGSVAAGLARTAPLISGAAVVMVAVFGAFAFAGILPIQQLGFGLALGVALDATVIRLIVVPAAMRLMGRWNWWLPGRPALGKPAPVTDPDRPGVDAAAPTMR